MVVKENDEISGLALVRRDGYMKPANMAVHPDRAEETKVHYLNHDEVRRHATFQNNKARPVHDNLK